MDNNDFSITWDINIDNDNIGRVGVYKYKDSNDVFVLENTKSIMNSQFSDMMTMFWVFNKHWAAMSEANKQQIWKYLKSLVLLARRVPAARQHPLLF
jgi:sensor histidine kinase YesM